MHARSRVVRFVPVAGGVLILGALALAGPLNPPPGPIVGTGKTTQEVFDKVAENEPRVAINATNTPGDADSVFKITQPGSYYLTENLTGQAGKMGIEIDAGGVTVDLNGFALTGVAGSLDGIGVPVSNQAITIRNGLIENWGGNGIGGLFTVVLGEVVGVRVQGCAGMGISFNDYSIVRDCIVAENAAGINVGSRSLITGCIVHFNTSTGIVMTHASTVVECVVGNNATIGIFASGGGGAILDTTVFGNSTDGISASLRTTVARCTVTVNGLNGITLGTACAALDNTCSLNGNIGVGAGIRVFGSDNRIEGNACTNADRGIDVDSTGNIIVKNTCSGNTTNWDIVANNVYGPIIDRTAPASPAVLGNAAASTLGSTDPNANFTY